MKNALLSQRVAVVGYVAPDANTAGAATSNAIDVSLFGSILAIVQAGDLGSSATLDFKFQGSTASGGSYADISGAVITQLTQAGTDSNKTVLLELKAETVLAAGYRYVKGVLTTATATSDSGVVILGGDCRYGPASAYNIAASTEGSVDEIVVA